MSQANDRWRRQSERNVRSFEVYIDQVKELPLISAQEEVRLARRIQAGHAGALQKLVEANLRFVIKIAYRYQFQGLPIPDLVNAGNLGLVRAAKRFDPLRGFKFISYAVWWIRQAILQAIAEEGRIVRIPPNRVLIKYQVTKAGLTLEQALLREPTPEEIAKELDLPVAEVVEAMNIANSHLSLDMPTADEEGPLIEIFQDSSIADPERDLERQQLRHMLLDLIDTLEEREAFIITKYFGLDGDTPLSLDAIGSACTPSLTRERVRQIKEDLLKLLRNRIFTTTLLNEHKYRRKLDDFSFL